MQKASVLLLAAVCLFISCNQFAGKTIRGEGPSSTEERSVGKFDEVQSFGSFDIILSSSSTPGVKVQAESNLQEYIDIYTDNNTLNIKQKRNYNIHSPKGITIYVAVPALRAIRLYGSGNVKTENQISAPDQLEISSSGSGDITYDLKAESLKAGLSGSGNLNLSGVTSDLETSISGSGNIRARDLQADKTNVRIAGSGNTEVVAKEKLNASISGSGSVRYWGSPEVNTHIAGSGSVTKAN